MGAVRRKAAKEADLQGKQDKNTVCRPTVLLAVVVSD